MAADNDGNFYLVFISGNFTNPPSGAIYVAKSTDGGITWPENLFNRLDDDLALEDKPWIIVDRTNQHTMNYIYVALSHAYPQQEIWFARSTNGANSFEVQTISNMPRESQYGTSLAIGQMEIYMLPGEGKHGQIITFSLLNPLMVE